MLQNKATVNIDQNHI